MDDRLHELMQDAADRGAPTHVAPAAEVRARAVRRRTRRRAAAAAGTSVVAVGLVVALGLGGGRPDATPTPAPPAATTTAVPPETTPAPPPTSEPGPTGTADPGDTVSPEPLTAQRVREVLASGTPRYEAVLADEAAQTGYEPEVTLDPTTWPAAGVCRTEATPLPPGVLGSRRHVGQTVTDTSVLTQVLVFDSPQAAREAFTARRGDVRRCQASAEEAGGSSAPEEPTQVTRSGTTSAGDEAFWELDAEERYGEPPSYGYLVLWVLRGNTVFVAGGAGSWADASTDVDRLVGWWGDVQDTYRAVVR
ncbi:hypothetical protein [Thalassiella azotivora]